MQYLLEFITSKATIIFLLNTCILYARRVESSLEWSTEKASRPVFVDIVGPVHQILEGLNVREAGLGEVLQYRCQ